jgi:hypothetical protein
MLMSSQIIYDALSPAVAISGSGLIALGMHNRLSNVVTRLRGLNQDYRLRQNTASKENLKNQQRLLLMRGRLLRNGLFFTYLSVVCMVLTAIGIALEKLAVVPATWGLTLWLFLGGLCLIVLGLCFECSEVLLLLRALKLDILETELISRSDTQAASEDLLQRPD